MRSGRKCPLGDGLNLTVPWTTEVGSKMAAVKNRRTPHPSCPAGSVSTASVLRLLLASCWWTWRRERDLVTWLPSHQFCFGGYQFRFHSYRFQCRGNEFGHNETKFGSDVIIFANVESVGGVLALKTVPKLANLLSTKPFEVLGHRKRLQSYHFCFHRNLPRCF